MPGIIVGIDGSDHSKLALEWAMKEAAIRRAPLTVIIVHPVIAGFSGRPVSYPTDAALVDKARETAREEVDKTLARLGGTGPGPETVTVQAVNGFPAEALISAGQDADLLVVGSRGSGGFSRLLLGSVSSQVTHHARCPVVVIPSEHRS
jgi:nucleotide-binding universal stress UspA family protein